MRIRSPRVLVSLVALGLMGCHSYRPIGTPDPGSIVRVQVPVTSAATGRNAPSQSISLEGVVVSAGDTLVLATETRREFGAFREVTQFDTLRLASDQTTSVDLREFSKGKSVALGVAISVGAVVLGVTAFNSGKNGGDVPKPPPGEPPAAFVVSSSFVSTILGLISR